jgi:hypothetical protein
MLAPVARRALLPTRLQLPGGGPEICAPELREAPEQVEDTSLYALELYALEDERADQKLLVSTCA